MDSETVSYRASFVLKPSRAASRAVRGSTLKGSQIEARVTVSVACKLFHMLNIVAHVIFFLEDIRCYREPDSFKQCDAKEECSLSCQWPGITSNHPKKAILKRGIVWHRDRGTENAYLSPRIDFGENFVPETLH